MSIQLREVNESNWIQVIRLKVTPEQEKFVASNVFSIAQSKIQPFWITRAIYDGETLVGFIMYGLERQESEFDGYWICRLMVDHQQQQKGYGKAAMEMAIQSIRESGYTDPIFVSFVVDNGVSEKLYQSLGFEDTGKVVEGEKIYRLSSI